MTKVQPLMDDEIQALLASPKCQRCGHRELVHDDGHCCGGECYICGDDVCPEFKGRRASTF